MRQLEQGPLGDIVVTLDDSLNDDYQILPPTPHVPPRAHDFEAGGLSSSPSSVPPMIDPAISSLFSI